LDLILAFLAFLFCLHTKDFGAGVYPYEVH